MRLFEEPILVSSAFKVRKGQTEMKKKSDALDADLAPIHGSVAFIDFLNKKSCRKPEVTQIHPQ